jgi:hypothetical protein
MKKKYLNFPVVFLKDAFANIRETMDNVMNYAGYIHAEKMQGNKTQKMKAAGNFFDINFGDPEQAYNSGQALFDQYPPNLPTAGISKDMCFDFYQNHKTEQEIAILVAYLALKSIIGYRKYAITTNAFLLSRMAGEVSKINTEYLPEQIKKYATRWQLDKIKAELTENWKVAFYGYRLKGFYFSFDLSLPELIEIAEKKRLQFKMQKYSGQQADARKKVIEKIYKSIITTS